MTRPKVLLIAYSCEPGRGSEWGVSWSLVNEFARHQPIWLIAHLDNRAGLDAYLAANPTPHPIHVTYVRGPRLLGQLRRAAYVLENVYYYAWQFAAARAARRLHAEVGFDVVQHISLSRWWMPSAASALAPLGVRVVFGPCVGGEQIPPGFRRNAPREVRFNELQRGAAVAIWSRDPLLGRCLRSADAVIVGTPASIDGVRAHRPKRIEVMTAVQISDTRLVDAARAVRSTRADDGIFRVCSVGGVNYFRGIDLILRALARSGIERFDYVHCCGGPLFDRMRALAAELGIADRVRFTGETKHAENLRHVARSDVLAHLVLRDSQGVVPESLSLGVPVLALDHHSMSPCIDDTVGHKIPMPREADADHVVECAARKFREWYDNRTLLPAMAESCIARSREFNPQYRVAQFRRWHDELLATGAMPATPTEPLRPIRASA